MAFDTGNGCMSGTHRRRSRPIHRQFCFGLACKPLRGPARRRCDGLSRQRSGATYDARSMWKKTKTRKEKKDAQSLTRTAACVYII